MCPTKRLNLLRLGPKFCQVNLSLSKPSANSAKIPMKGYRMILSLMHPRKVFDTCRYPKCWFLKSMSLQIWPCYLIYLKFHGGLLIVEDSNLHPVTTLDEKRIKG